uniref:Histone-lysine N-methyltransferase n=1 Tax=Panagrolaimus sp. ES5 TaxID=591445 RepID=A0AC34FZR3_9BILA
MAITRSQTKAIRQVKESSPLPPPPPPPVPVASSLSSKGKRKNVNPGGKEGVQVVKKARFSKDSSSNTPTPPPVSVPPLPPMIEENKISRNAQEIIKDTKVLQCYCKPEFGCDERCVNRALHMECGSRCKIGDQCQNKRFQKLQYAAFEPFFAGVKGWGIRAVKPIHSGDFIVEYVGEVVDSWEMAKRQKKYTKNNHKHHYMMSLRNGAVIDATTCGNFSRFVNHSCDPNAETQKWVVSREIRIGFFAKKEIAAGEEIVFDYAFERFGKEAQQCYCGSENCTGFIGSKPDEGDNEDEEAGSSSSTSEETDDETTKDAANITKKVTKPKLTQEQKEFRKRMAKARRRLVKARREFRKVVGRKKNFSEEEILEFNRQMYRINDYDQRFLIVNFMLTVPDDQWKRTFIEKNGIEVIWSWLTDYTDNRVPLKTFVRLQNGLIKFLDSLPVEYNDHLKLIIAVIKDIMNQQLPDDIILQETLNELIDDVVSDEPEIPDKDLARMLDQTLNELIDDVVSDEPEIPDKDLARMLDRDKVSMIKVYGETVEICKRLYGVWSTLPSQLTDGCVDISGDEMDEILEDELPSYETAMETNFDTPEHVSKPETEIVNEVDIGARKHFRSSSRSEKENSHEKRFRSRSRSRSFSPPKRQRSCSKSPIGFGNYLQIAAKTDYRDRDSDRKYSDRFDHYRNRDRKYRYDDHQRGKHFKDRRTDRYYDD